MNKILILLPYYNRPKLVKNALNSILRTKYENWHLAFFDDGSPIPGKPIVEEILPLDKVTFYNSNMSAEDKKIDGCRMGHYLNVASLESDADIIITLCDDDELFPTYLENLDTFFSSHPEEVSCYSKIHLFNPFLEKSEDVDNLGGHYNKCKGRIRPSCKVEVSQVAWRMSAVVDGARWRDNCTGNHDVYFLEELYEKTGKLTAETDFIAQYKGMHYGQLGRRAYDEKSDYNLNTDLAWGGFTESDDSSVEVEMLIKEAIAQAHAWGDFGVVDKAVVLLTQVLKVGEKVIKEKYPEVYFMLGMLLAPEDKETALEMLTNAVKYSKNEENNKYVLSVIENLDNIEKPVVDVAGGQDLVDKIKKNQNIGAC